MRRDLVEQSDLVEPDTQQAPDCRQLLARAPLPTAPLGRSCLLVRHQLVKHIAPADAPEHDFFAQRSVCG